MSQAPAAAEYKHKEVEPSDDDASSGASGSDSDSSSEGEEDHPMPQAPRKAVSDESSDEEDEQPAKKKRGVATEEESAPKAINVKKATKKPSEMVVPEVCAPVKAGATVPDLVFGVVFTDSAGKHHFVCTNNPVVATKVTDKGAEWTKDSLVRNSVFRTRQVVRAPKDHARFFAEAPNKSDLPEFVHRDPTANKGHCPSIFDWVIGANGAAYRCPSINAAEEYERACHQSPQAKSKATVDARDNGNIKVDITRGRIPFQEHGGVLSFLMTQFRFLLQPEKSTTAASSSAAAAKPSSSSKDSRKRKSPSSSSSSSSSSLDVVAQEKYRAVMKVVFEEWSKTILHPHVVKGVTRGEFASRVLALEAFVAYLWDLRYSKSIGIGEEIQGYDAMLAERTAKEEERKNKRPIEVMQRYHDVVTWVLHSQDGHQEMAELKQRYKTIDEAEAKTKAESNNAMEEL